MRKFFYALCLAPLALLHAACVGDEGDPGLAVYAGIFDVAESFNRQEGTQCPQPPVGSFQNSVDVRIDKSQFEARFEERWGTLYGDIDGTLEFRAVDNDALPNQTFRLTGRYDDGDRFTGSMEEIRQGCSRFFDVFAQRVPEEDS